MSVFSTPPELMLPVPRIVRRRRSLSWPLKIGMAACCTLAVLLIVGCIGEFILLTCAPLLKGVITARSGQDDFLGDSTILIQYRFADLDGQTVNASARVRGTYKTLKVGSRIDVRSIHVAGFASSEPDLIYKHLSVERWKFWVLGESLGLLSLGALWIDQRRRWLIHYGRPAIGRVIVRDGETDAAIISITVAYIPSDEEFYVFAGGGNAFLKTVRLDDLLTVLYDPAQPKRSVIYETSPYECVGKS